MADPRMEGTITIRLRIRDLPPSGLAIDPPFRMILVHIGGISSCARRAVSGMPASFDWGASDLKLGSIGLKLGCSFWASSRSPASLAAANARRVAKPRPRRPW